MRLEAEYSALSGKMPRIQGEETLVRSDIYDGIGGFHLEASSRGVRLVHPDFFEHILVSSPCFYFDLRPISELVDYRSVSNITVSKELHVRECAV